MTLTAVAEPAKATVNYVCCGARLSHVHLTGLGAQLSYTHCNRCQATRWYRGDSPTDPAKALSLPEVPPTHVSHHA
jgi:hypothetical protein